MKKILLPFFLLLLFALPAQAFMKDGCGAGECRECHSLAKPEAQKLVQDFGGTVNSVQPAEVPGLWMLEVQRGDKKYPVFIDFSKQFLVVGDILRIADRENITKTEFMNRNPVNYSSIPLQDALLLGSAKAKTKAVVFTDPQCPYCIRLHKELQEVVRRDPTIAFYIKLFPLKIHPKAYGISQSIICNQSMELLEKSFAGEEIPKAECNTPVVDQTLALGKQLGIRSTPTIVFPDGRVAPGYKKADQILGLLGSKVAQEEAK